MFAEDYALSVSQGLANHREYQRVAFFVRIQRSLHLRELFHVVELVLEVGGDLKVFRGVVLEEVLGLGSVVYLKYSIVDVVEGDGSSKRVLVLGRK